MLRAIAAAESQTMSHRSAEGWLAARTAAARPMAPMPAPPRPGTAVNVELRSIVRRMKCRLSSACWPNEVTAAGSPDRRDIQAKVARIRLAVKELRMTKQNGVDRVLAKDSGRPRDVGREFRSDFRSDGIFADHSVTGRSPAAELMASCPRC